MLKVMTVVGTRPELIKMSRVISLFDKHTRHVLVHTGQNYDYELNQIFFEDLEIRPPDYFLEAVGDTVAQTISKIILKSDEVFELEKPDAVLLYGDTNSCLSVLSAKRRKIPVFHMEAGNRCFDERVPEELNRIVLDHLSDINLVLTEHARRYLIAEGIRPETVVKTGSHMREVIDFYKPKIDRSRKTTELSLEVGKFFLVSAHREENVDSPEKMIDFIATLEAIASEYGFPVVVSTHPRTQKRLEKLLKGPLSGLIRFMRPFSFTDYVRLQLDATCVVSDSGTLAEEAALLGLPAVMIRDSHERPEGMESGAFIMAGLKQAAVLNAIRVTIEEIKSKSRSFQKVDDYEIEGVSGKLLKVVLSYTAYINRTVWRRYD